CHRVPRALRGGRSLMRLPLPLGGGYLLTLKRQGVPFAEPIMVRLWDQVREVTATALTAFPGRDPRHHDWSLVQGMDVAIHISDETTADQFLAIAEALIQAKAETVFV